MSELHKLLGKLREFVDVVAGDNRPSREWAIEHRGAIDSLPERALAEGVRVPELRWPDGSTYELTIEQGRRAMSAALAKPGELDEIEAMLCEGQGDDDGPQILPDFEQGMSTLAKVEACLHLLELRRDALAALEPAAPEGGQDTWRDDPSADERWSAGLDFGMNQLCAALGVDPQAVNWDAATETLDGDVQSVIWNILRAKFGEDFPSATPPAPVVTQTMVEAAAKGAFDELMKMADETHIPVRYTESISVSNYRVMRAALTAALSKTGGAS